MNTMRARPTSKTGPSARAHLKEERKKQLNYVYSIFSYAMHYIRIRNYCSYNRC